MYIRVEIETIGSHFIDDILKVGRGTGGASVPAPPPPPPPEANGISRSQIKWKLLSFDESDFFLLTPVYFFALFRAMLFILSQIKKHVFFKIKPDYQMVRP